MSLIVGLFIYPVVRRVNKIDKVAYSDGCFYNTGIDPTYYFIDRLLKGSKDGGDVITQNDENLNTSRYLKPQVDAKPVNANENVLVLVENKAVDIGIAEQNKNDSNKVLKQNNKHLDKKDHYDFITYNDYTLIEKKFYFSYDLRNSSKYIEDELTLHHSVLKLFMKDSIIEPRLISFLQLIYRVNLVCLLNTITFTDNLIEMNANNPYRVYIGIIIGNYS
jgi:hypothetical protein